MQISVQEISKLIQAEIIGDKDFIITDISYTKDAKKGDLVLANKSNYFKQAIESECSVILADKVYHETDKTILLIEDANSAFIKLLEMQIKPNYIPHDTLIHPTAKIGKNCNFSSNVIIGENTTVGENCVFYPNVYIGANCNIGDNCTIYPNVCIYDRSILGNRVILHSGVVISADGFGYEPCFIHGLKKYPHIGIVRLCDDVEIGANTTIDRAKLGETYIGRGTKIDNLVQIAHNVRIGEFCVICGLSGIAGSTAIGDYCVLGAQTGIADHIELGKNVIASARAGATKSFADGSIISGYPAHPISQERRVEAIKSRLPEMHNKMKAMQNEIEKLNKLVENIEKKI